MERFRTLEGAVTEVRDESRTAVEGVRQASAGKAEISDLQVRRVTKRARYADKSILCSLWLGYRHRAAFRKPCGTLDMV